MAVQVLATMAEETLRAVLQTNRANLASSSLSKHKDNSPSEDHSKSPGNKGQMDAALGGTTGVEGLARALQRAFQRHAQKV